MSVWIHSNRLKLSLLAISTPSYQEYWLWWFIHFSSLMASFMMRFNTKLASSLKANLKHYSSVRIRKISSCRIALIFLFYSIVSNRLFLISKIAWWLSITFIAKDPIIVMVLNLFLFLSSRWSSLYKYSRWWQQSLSYWLHQQFYLLPHCQALCSLSTSRVL